MFLNKIKQFFKKRIKTSEQKKEVTEKTEVNPNINSVKELKAQGLTIKQISERLNITESQVKYRLYRK